MNYPDNFETAAFPAGRRIAVSRVAAIGTAIVFLLICFACGIMLWTMRSARVHPFLISVNDASGIWQVVGHDHGRKTVSATRTLQESVVGNLVRNWFRISDDAFENAAIWRECDRSADCDSEDATVTVDGDCAMFCVTSADLFTTFVNDIVPGYRARAQNDQQWSVDMDSLRITPASKIDDRGGTWRVQATVMTNTGTPMDIIAFAVIRRDKRSYPRTMGFYVADFNAYKIN